jgi:hypothetical protein
MVIGHGKGHFFRLRLTNPARQAAHEDRNRA